MGGMGKSAGWGCTRLVLASPPSSCSLQSRLPPFRSWLPYTPTRVSVTHLFQAFNRSLENCKKPFVEMTSYVDSQHTKQIKVGLVWCQLGVRARAPLSFPPFQNAPEAIPVNPTEPLTLSTTFLEQMVRRRPGEAGRLAQGHSGRRTESRPGLPGIHGVCPCVLHGASQSHTS